MRPLSDQQLVARLENLRRREHKVTIGILFLLREVERRKLYLRLGHASLFDFAVRRLGYSESAAGRRLQAARCIARHPEIGAMLQRHEANLSTVALVSRVLTDENKAQLLERIRGKSQRDVLALVAEMSPVTRIRDQVNPVCLRTPDRSAHSRSGSDEGSPDLLAPAATLTPVAATGPCGAAPPAMAVASVPAACETVASSAHGFLAGATASVAVASESAPLAPAHSRSGSAGITEMRYKVQFGARREVIRKLEEARALLSNRFPRGATLEDVIEAALDALLEQTSPARRQARRVERRGETRILAQPKAVAEAPRSRHIPAAVRDTIYVRDDGRCTYVGTDGKRCGSTHFVQVDHIEPFVLNGANESSNLRLLCGPHNRLEAERILGSNWPTRARS